MFMTSFNKPLRHTALCVLVAFMSDRAAADEAGNSSMSVDVIGSTIGSILTANGQTDAAQPVPAQPNEQALLEYRVVNMTTRNVLMMLAEDTGQRFDMTDKVAGTVINTSLSGSAVEILDALCKLQALDAFEYAGVTYVSARSESMTRLIPLGSLPMERARAALNESGLDLIKFPIQSVAYDRAISMSGPPALLAIAEAVISVVPAADQPVLAASGIIVRRGTAVSVESFGADRIASIQALPPGTEATQSAEAAAEEVISE